MCTSTKLYFWTFFFFITLSLNAQTGPAGVGNSSGANGQPENVLWLDASDLTSFGPGSTWADKSGNGHDAFNDGGNISLSSLGGQNALDFSALSSGNFSIPHDPVFDDMEALSVFVVFNTGNSTDPQGLVSKRNGSGDATFTMFLWNDYILNADYNTSGNRISGAPNSAGTSYIGNFIFEVNDSSKIYKNGALDNNAFRLTGATPINNTTADIEIGKLDENYSTFFQGQIAEIIIYKNNLSEVQRVMVQSYLAQKYGIAVEDVQVNYAPASDDFWQDVAGIAQKSLSVREFGASSGLYLDLVGSSEGDYALAGHNGALNDEASLDVSAAVTSSGAQAAWNRVWFVQKSGNGNVKLSFDLSEGFQGGLYPQEIGNYVLLRKDNATGNYSEVTALDKGVEESDRIWFEVSDADFNNGYFTLGTTDQVLSPLQGAGSRIWYSLRSTGNWDEPSTWTLAPCGCVPDNPSGLTPATSPTSASDKVVILSGKKVTVPVGIDNLHNEALTVHGELDMGTTAGHSFNNISGTGIISMAGDNFPDGNAFDFVTEGEGEGKVEFYGGNYSISSVSEFFNVDVVLDNSASEITILNDFTVNGVLSIQNGVFKIGDNTSTDGIDVNVKHDLLVHSGTSIVTGTADARHSLNLYGNFTNSGTVAFTNRITPDYSNEATNGIVDFRLINESDDQIVNCNGITRFYRIAIEKGVRARTAAFNASSPAYFSLLGAADYTNSETSNNNAFGLISGTAKLGPNINIEVLNTAGNYHIYSDAGLWVDGAVVRKNIGNSLVPYGELRLTSGLVEAKVSNGITTRLNGIVHIEGGILNTNQIKTSVMGVEHNGAYIQSGGTVNVLGGITNTDFYVFNLTHEDNSFEMSGGVLNINAPNSMGGIFINSIPGNFNVTGGNVVCNIGNNDDFIITSRAPFYNLELTNSSGNNVSFILDEGIDVGSTDEDLVAQPLVVINDLTIGEDCLLDHNGMDVTVGRHMRIDANATPGPGGTPRYRGYLYDASKPNTTIFNGIQNGELYLGHDVEDGYEQWFWNVTVNKNSGRRITLSGDNAKQADNVTAPWRARLIRVENEFNVESGIFDQGMHSARLFGPINIKENGVCGVYQHGTTHQDALIMLKDGDVQINTEDGAEIGNLKLNPVPNETIISFNSDVRVRRIAWYNGRINIGSNHLTLDYLHRNGTLNPYPVSDGNVNQMIISNGMASDGGLSLYIPENSDGSAFAFPLGVGDTGTEPGSKYTYANVSLRSNTDDGYITINPVDKELQTADLTGGDVLSYYWRVRYEGFDQLPQVEYLFKYYDEDVSGNSNSYRPGSVLAVNPFTRSFEDDNSKVDEATNTILFNGGGAGFELSESHYTAGDKNCFTGAPLVYYTRDVAREPRWTWGNAWTRSDMLDDIDGNGTVDEDEYHDSRQPAANNYPGPGDIAVIGWVPWGNTQSSGEEGEPHGMWIDNNNQECAELIFSQMKDAAGNPVPRVYRSNFQFRPTLCINENGQLTAGMVRGEGMYWNRWSDPDFSLVDIGEFAQNDSSYIVYENNWNDRTYNNAPDIVPNLLIANDGWGQYDKNVTFPNDIEATGNFEILGDLNLILSNGIAGDITIGRDLLMFEQNNSSEGNPSGGGASIVFPNNSERHISVDRDLIMENEEAHIFVNNPDATVNDHTISVGRNIIQESAGNGADGLQLFTNINQDRITLLLNGNENMVYSHVNGDVPDFYRIVVNKGSGINTRAQFDGDFNLHGVTSGAGVSKAVDLQSGLLIMNHPNIDIDLSTGDDFFEINNTSGIEVRQGQMNINGGSGLSLDGLLRVSGGTFDMSGGDHPVIYSASGNARIEVTGGSLLVGSQVRRSATNDMGALQYSQRNGSVVIGTDAGGIASRGMLEVLNPGSEFRHTGGSLQILRQNGAAPASPALYLAPETSVVSGSEITLFGGTTPIGQTDFELRADIPLNRLVVNGINSPGVTLQTSPLIMSGDLQINSGAAFDANGLDMELKANFINDGTFAASGNEVLFSGASNQEIFGNTSFYKLKKNGSASLDLGSATNITVEYLLELNSGVINDNGNNIFVLRDVFNNGAFVSGSTGNGVVLNGTSAQKIVGEGSFEKLWLENSAGFSQVPGNVITINENLQLEEGVFDIGNNEIVFETGAQISNSLGQFSETNMIQTNASFSDGGIRKYLNPGAASFVFPIGSQGIFTPAELNMTANSASGGYLRIKASNEIHPSIVDDPATSMVEPTNVLKYYWVVDAGDITDFEGDISMAYSPSLVQVTEAGYSYSDYITARILSRGEGEWNKNIGTVDTDAHILSFGFNAATDADGISGDYTAGIDEAIPDQVPVYTSVKDGDWTDVSVWSPAPPSGGPRGAIVVVMHDVTIPVDYVVAYKTNLDGASDGRLLIPGTEGHRLGIVDGTGTLYVETAGVPAGEYSTFFAEGGGTIEFGGNGVSYPVLGGIYDVNNLKFSGSGIREFPNTLVRIKGDLIIDGDASLLVDNRYDKTISVKGDITFNSGRFGAGEGADAVVELNGTAPQSIQGAVAFTGENAFYNLKMNNPNGAVFTSPVEITNLLTLQSGRISTNSGILTLTNPSVNAVVGGGAQSYIEGPMVKYINHNSYFDFPVGHSGRFGNVQVSSTSTSGVSAWQAEYFNVNPGSNGLNPESFQYPVAFVSRNEYWRVAGPASGKAFVTIRWDNQSGISSSQDERDDLRMVGWKDHTPDDEWIMTGVIESDGGQNTGKLRTSSQAQFNDFTNGNFFTIGAISISNYPWLGYTADWFDTGNWQSASIPSGNTVVEIPAADEVDFLPEVDGDAFCMDLTINANATVTLMEGATMNVTNQLINNGEIILMSTPEAISALNVPVSNTNSGMGRIELPLKKDQWYRLGQPFVSPTGLMYDAADGASWVYRSTTQWERITDNSEIIDPMEGIMVLYTADHNLSSFGQLNSGPKHWTIPYGIGYYLFSNPYPSSIKWDIDNVDDTGVSISDNLSATIYYRVYAGSQVGDYMITYNGFTGVSVIEDGGSLPGGYTSQNIGTISPLQSVWVKVNDSNSATIDLSNKARVNDNSLPLKSASSENGRDIIRIVQSNDLISDAAIVYFDEAFDSGQEHSDSEKMFNTSKQVPEIFTRLGDKNLCMNGLPALGNDGISIPLSVKIQVEGDVEMRVSLDEFSNQYDVLLEDKETGIFTDLRLEDSYNYTPQMGVVHERFVLHLQPVLEVPTNLVENESGQSDEIRIRGFKNYALVEIPESLIPENGANIELMDMNGRVVTSFENTKSTETRIPLPENSGVYIVRVTTSDTVASKKVVQP
jgi:hypothetical protein